MTELLSNLAASVLSAPITTTGAITPTVQSGTKFPSTGNFRIRIDQEHMLVTARSGNTLTIPAPNRGIEGTTAATHLSGADVRHVLTTAGLDTRVTETIAALRAAANGYASLDGSGKIPSAQLPASAVELKGTWDASVSPHGNPAITDATGSLGDEYVVSVGGTRTLGPPGGSITWAANDLALHNGTQWEQIAGAGGVAGVSQIGLRTGSPLTGNVAANALITGLTLVMADITDATAILNAKADASALAAKADATALDIVGTRVLTSVTGTPYTFVLTDAGNVFDGNTACVLKIPALATTNFPEGSWIEVCNTQGLTVEIQSATGTMIETPLSPGTRVASVWIKPQYGSCRFRKRAAASDFWIASGDHSLT